MPQYRVLEKSFIGNCLVDEDAVVDYEGVVGSNMQIIESPKADKFDKAARKITKPDTAENSVGLV